MKLSKMFPNWASSLRKEEALTPQPPNQPGSHPLHGKQMSFDDASSALIDLGAKDFDMKWHPESKSYTSEHYHPTFGRFSVQHFGHGQKPAFINHIGGEDLEGKSAVAARQRFEADEFERYGSAGN